MAAAGGQAVRDVIRRCQVFFRPRSRLWRVGSYDRQRGAPTGRLAGSGFTDGENGVFRRRCRILALHTPNFLPARPSKPRKACFAGSERMKLGLNCLRGASRAN
ncbi:hypothetical protein NN561_011489 [Cricetulus griseus]